ncbi:MULTISPECIES: nitroreductase family protein [unclassified Pseudodesulfovibrio]|uniref:nitroreductase family protein n=1 Tax=unclassified Pseudodesulfovibrio TaxID=2661612 RepID=UPI000FEB7542|nr:MULTISPECIES: nitroreductase family protein [unclassified Pseudodesulfovibrio]MCJ2165689.1 nitroreductase family protein [Pseudodesulfovibrio sp. S3-i]RWU02952.1 4Fe-4S dicluster domain-containing protein [Pseudodesulfovibrio sp. S3]
MFADKDICKQCGACLDECPFDLIVDGADGFPKLRPAARKTCINCGHCVAVCPVGAVTLPEMPAVSQGLSPEQCVPLVRDLKLTPDQAEQFLCGRRSVRAYRDKVIPEDVLNRLFSISRFAPSAKNGQPARWIITRTPQATRRLAGLTVEYMATHSVFPGVVKNWSKGLDKILHGAPHVAVAHAPEDGFNPAEDCSLAAAYLELAAHAHGIGACWAGFLMEVAEGCCAIRETLGIPEGHGVYAALMLGYPKYRYKRIPARKDVEIAWLD